MAWFFIIYLVIGAMFAFVSVLRRPNAEITLSNYATSEKAAKAIFKGINKQEADIIVPKLPWSVLSRLITILPDQLVSKVF